MAAAAFGPGKGEAMRCLRARLEGGRALQRTVNTQGRPGGAAAAWERGAGSNGGNQSAAKAAGVHPSDKTRRERVRGQARVALGARGALERAHRTC